MTATNAGSASSGLRVREGEQMPSVGLRASDGYLMNLRSYVGRQPSMFLFFAGPSLSAGDRASGDAIALAFKEACPRLGAAGVAVAGVTTDSERQQAAYIAELELPYPLFCDERRSAVELLGVPTTSVNGNVNAEPIAFAVGADGTILDIVERIEPRGLVARLLEAIHPPD
jgi:peroxiredoxin Q/BCP